MLDTAVTGSEVLASPRTILDVRFERVTTPTISLQGGEEGERERGSHKNALSFFNTVAQMQQMGILDISMLN